MIKPLFSKLLPSDRKSQPPTLLVISTHTIARVFFVDKYDIHELHPLHTENTDYAYSDKEWFSYINTASDAGRWTITWFHEKNKMHYDHVFAKFMVKEIQKLDKKYQAKKIIIYAPKDLKKILIEFSPKAYADKLTIIMGNRIKIWFPKLFELIK